MILRKVKGVRKEKSRTRGKECGEIRDKDKDACTVKFTGTKKQRTNTEDIKVIIYRKHKRFLAFWNHVQFLKSLLKFFPKTVLPNANKQFSFFKKQKQGLIICTKRGHYINVNFFLNTKNKMNSLKIILQ